MKTFCLLSDERAFKSRSPAMLAGVFKRVGLRAAYVPFCVAAPDLGPAVAGLKALHIAGANVTVPHKEAIIPFLDGLAPEAAAIGAVNTLVPGEAGLVGHNTDAPGLLEALGLAGFQAAGQAALVLGSGGAARAALAALRSQGARPLLLAGRSAERTRALAESFGAEPLAWERLAADPPPATLLINATSASAPAEAPELARLAAGLKLRGLALVMDLNYGRRENLWRDLAQAHGAAFQDGLTLLAGQARLSLRLWTGLDAPVQVFLQALEETA